MRLCRVVFAVWLAVWLFFFLEQSLWKWKFINKCQWLLSKDLEGRRASAYGEDFYAFLKFCRQTILKDRGFNWLGRQSGLLTG